MVGPLKPWTLRLPAQHQQVLDHKLATCTVCMYSLGSMLAPAATCGHNWICAAVLAMPALHHCKLPMVQQFLFDCRWGKKAGTLLGHKLDHITVGSRTSCYVPAVQKLVGR
jgi:hypothetical protein